MPIMGPPDSWILREPPEACEEHGEDKRFCLECENMRQYYEDLAADAAYESWRLGE